MPTYIAVLLLNTRQLTGPSRSSVYEYSVLIMCRKQTLTMTLVWITLDVDCFIIATTVYKYSLYNYTVSHSGMPVLCDAWRRRFQKCFEALGHETFDS